MERALLRTLLTGQSGFSIFSQLPFVKGEYSSKLAPQGGMRALGIEGEDLLAGRQKRGRRSVEILLPTANFTCAARVLYHSFRRCLTAPG